MLLALPKTLMMAIIAASSVAARAPPSPSLELFARAPSLVKKPPIMETYKNWANATCYADLYANDRQLPYGTEPPLDTSKMTVEICLDYCESKGFVFAGLEYGLECYCGKKRPHWYWINDRDDCDHSCSGNARQNCGGDQYALVYARPSGENGS